MRNRRRNKLFAIILCAVLTGAAWSNERVIYVDAAAAGSNDGSSWADAYCDLQDALADANEAVPAMIRVAQGTYRPGLALDATAESRDATFRLHNHVTLEGGYAGVAGNNPNARDVERYRTVLDGDLAENGTPETIWDSAVGQDNARYVVTGGGTDETAVIDGFTISGGGGCGMEILAGSPCVYRCRFVGNVDAGIEAKDCNSVLAECAFERNGPATFNWGGINSVRGHLTLVDCGFVENHGGAIRNTGTLDLLRCSFIGNKSFLVAGVENAGKLEARRCCFRSNKGTPIQCYSDPALIGRDAPGGIDIVDCQFAGNVSNYAGAIRALGNLNLVRCEFIGNSGDDINGGALTIEGDVLLAKNCLFVGNSGRRRGGAICDRMAVVLKLSHCTFVGNRGWPSTIESIHFPGRTVVELTQCIVWNGPDPFRKFASSPDFVVTQQCTGRLSGRGEHRR